VSSVSLPHIQSIFLSVCPDGFEWFDQNGCVAIITTSATKENAIKQCKSLNPSAQLMMPKTDFIQSKLEQFIAKRTTSKADFFLGMEKTDGKWIWDDGPPVFVRRKGPFK
jgi:hypothetical protein